MGDTTTSRWREALYRHPRARRNADKSSFLLERTAEERRRDAPRRSHELMIEIAITCPFFAHCPLHRSPYRTRAISDISSPFITGRSDRAHLSSFRLLAIANTASSAVCFHTVDVRKFPLERFQVEGFELSA